MKILLIDPRNSLIRPPQALHYIASAVNAAGHIATIHDEALFDGPSESLRHIHASDADVFGISVYTSRESIDRATEISQSVKKMRNSTATIVWGGWHPTLYAHDCMKDNTIDIVVRGPGENVTCNLLYALQHRTSLRTIKGIVFREGKDVVETSMESMDQTRLFPKLDYSLIDIEKYIQRHDQGCGRFSYLTSRGCFGRCAFCSSRLIDRQKRFRKPMTQCIDEMQHILSHHEVHHVVISDPVAFANSRQASDLIEMIKQSSRGKKLPWRCDARIDVLSRLSENTFRELADSGCSGFAIGIESGVDRVLQLMQKDITEDQISKVLDSLARHGFHKNLFWFMAGFSGETSEEASRTLSLACRIRMVFPQSNIVLTWYKPQLAGETCCISNGERHMRIGKTPIGVADYYLSASGRRQDRRKGFARLINLMYVLKVLYKKIMFIRIKRQFFSFPIEYVVFKWREMLRLRFTNSGPRH